MSEDPSFNPVPIIAKEMDLPPAKVGAVVAMLAEGNTVPFVDGMSFKTA